MSDESFSLRLATAADAPALAALRHAFRAELAPPSEPREAFERRCAGWMAARLAAPSAWRCWVATGSPGEQQEAPGDAILAMLWAQRIEKVPNPVDEPEMHLYVTSFYVAPAARGGGLGSRMLAAVLGWARAERVDAVLLWPSARSRSLYLRHGFAVRDDVLELRLGGGR